jgi:hypothetical protein
MHALILPFQNVGCYHADLESGADVTYRQLNGKYGITPSLPPHRFQGLSSESTGPELLTKPLVAFAGKV